MKPSPLSSISSNISLMFSCRRPNTSGHRAAHTHQEDGEVVVVVAVVAAVAVVVTVVVIVVVTVLVVVVAIAWCRWL